MTIGLFIPVAFRGGFWHIHAFCFCEILWNVFRSLFTPVVLTTLMAFLEGSLLLLM